MEVPAIGRRIILKMRYLCIEMAVMHVSGSHDARHGMRVPVGATFETLQDA